MVFARWLSIFAHILPAAAAPPRAGGANYQAEKCGGALRRVRRRKGSSLFRASGKDLTTERIFKRDNYRTKVSPRVLHGWSLFSRGSLSDCAAPFFYYPCVSNTLRLPLTAPPADSTLTGVINTLIAITF